MARLQRGAMRHPKIAALSDEAFRLWIAGNDYCDEMLTDGVIAKAVLGNGSVAARVTPLLLAELTTPRAPYTHPLWHDRGDHYEVHDYLDWNDSREEVQRGRKKLRERVRRHRLGQAQGGEASAPSARVTGERASHGSCNAVTNGVTTPVTDSVTHAVTNGVTTPVTNGVCTPVCNAVNNEQRPTNNVPPPPTPAPCRGHRSAPLTRPARVDVAWAGRPNVPGALHLEFRLKLGGDPDQADATLRAWYPTVAAAWADTAIGDDDWHFWRARFLEWVGSTVRTGTDRTAADVQRATGPAYEGLGWWEDCKRLHAGRCENKLRHLSRMRIERERTDDALAEGEAEPRSTEVLAVGGAVS